MVNTLFDKNPNVYVLHSFICSKENSLKLL